MDPENVIAAADLFMAQRCGETIPEAVGRLTGLDMTRHHLVFSCDTLYFTIERALDIPRPE
jgi:hypothetical protein